MVGEIEHLLPEISQRVREIQKTRAIPEDLIGKLKRAGAFRALIPRDFGGVGLDFESYTALIQRIATIDASVAWCINQASVIGLTSLWLPERSIRHIWGQPDTSVSNGPPLDSQIIAHEENYLLSGHWGFSSGCQHATWMAGLAKHESGGYRLAYFRPDDVEFVDNWEVAGLQGTGSFEFKVKNLAVPQDMVADMSRPASVCIDLTLMPNTLLFAASFACVALGLARASLNDIVDLAQGKIPRWTSLKLKDDPDVQRFIGKATARWKAADAYLHRTIETLFPVIRQSNTVTHQQRAEMRMVGTHVIQECAEVVGVAYRISGSSGIYQELDLQRRFQDMNVITQHVQGREAYFAILGRHELTGNYEIGPMT